MMKTSEFAKKTGLSHSMMKRHAKQFLGEQQQCQGFARKLSKNDAWVLFLVNYLNRVFEKDVVKKAFDLGIPGAWIQEYRINKHMSVKIEIYSMWIELERIWSK